MKSTLATLIISTLFLIAAPAHGAVREEIFLWPGAVPGDKGEFGDENQTRPASGGKLVQDKPVLRLEYVVKPSITLFRPAKDKDTGTAVVVCPGGGYNILAWDLEGTEVCEWLNSIGVTGVLLKYRVPRRKDTEKHGPPLQDAQRAFGLVRAHAGGWGIDPKRVGILGFSAGGHLSAVASTNFEKRTYEPVDEADKLSCRPDFAVLIYPAYLTVQKEGDKISPELPINANTPPTFLAQTQDDGVRVESSLFYYLALKQAKVPSELHIYPTGGHGYGLRSSEHNVTTWPQRAGEWMRARGLLEVKQ